MLILTTLILATIGFLLMVNGWGLFALAFFIAAAAGPLFYLMWPVCDALEDLNERKEENG